MVHLDPWNFLSRSTFHCSNLKNIFWLFSSKLFKSGGLKYKLKNENDPNLLKMETNDFFFQSFLSKIWAFFVLKAEKSSYINMHISNVNFYEIISKIISFFQKFNFEYRNDFNSFNFKNIFDYNFFQHKKMMNVFIYRQ